MKPRNFPERKRQRQLVALSKLDPADPKDKDQIAVLLERTAENMRNVRTKKPRLGKRRPA